jgi:ketosteroid isomerase-like protein
MTSPEDLARTLASALDRGSGSDLRSLFANTATVTYGVADGRATLSVDDVWIEALQPLAGAFEAGRPHVELRVVTASEQGAAIELSLRGTLRQGTDFSGGCVLAMDIERGLICSVRAHTDTKRVFEELAQPPTSPEEG